MNPVGTEQHPADGKSTALDFSLLARELQPGRDLWPEIAVRLQKDAAQTPRVGRRQFARYGMSLALAATMVAALSALLGPILSGPQQVDTVAAAFSTAPLGAENRALVKANLKLADDAERQLLRALESDPEALYLQRLLQATAQRQNDLRVLLAQPVDQDTTA